VTQELREDIAMLPAPPLHDLGVEALGEGTEGPINGLGALQFGFEGGGDGGQAGELEEEAEGQLFVEQVEGVELLDAMAGEELVEETEAEHHALDMAQLLHPSAQFLAPLVSVRGGGLGGFWAWAFAFLLLIVILIGAHPALDPFDGSL
jgi:hypothetical protein